LFLRPAAIAHGTEAGLWHFIGSTKTLKSGTGRQKSYGQCNTRV